MAPVRCSRANCKASEALTASRLDSPHARRAQPTVRSLFDLVCDAFPALERLTVIDRADVHEHVWRVRLGVEHEATPLLALEEFHGAGETNIEPSSSRSDHAFGAQLQDVGDAERPERSHPYARQLAAIGQVPDRVLAHFEQPRGR